MKKPVTPTPPQKYLRECYDYDPLTGEVRWRVRPRHHFKKDGGYQRWNKLFAGKKTGCAIPNYKTAYSILKLDGVNYRAHRMIWTWMTSEQPPEQMDHKDTNGLNNTWTNLRAATDTESARNRYVFKRKPELAFLPKGVYINNKGYQAAIRHHRKLHCLGTFATVKEARDAYIAEGTKLHGEFFNAGDA